jgi:hypothetical protein
MSFNDKLLAERLRQEAMQSRPAFSEALHARVLHAVQTGPAEERPLPRRAASGWRLRRMLPAAAAVCLLMAVGVGWRVLRPTAPPPGGGQQVAHRAAPSHGDPAIAMTTLPASDVDALAELADQATDGLGTLVDAAVVSQQSAYLDHDVRLAAEILMDRLPLDLTASEEPR